MPTRWTRWFGLFLWVTACLAGHLRAGAPAKFLLTEDIGGKTQVFEMNDDGSARVQLTFLPLGASGARWSPDKSKIAFLSPVARPQGLVTEAFVANADGSGVQQVTNLGEHQFGIDWIGAAELVLSVDQGTRGRLLRVAATPPFQVTPFSLLGAGNVNPRFHAGQSQIAYAGGDSQGTAGFVKVAGVLAGMEAGARQFPGQQASTPAWSSNGQSVVFHLRGNAPTGVLAVWDLASGNVSTLTADPGDSLFPVWSPQNPARVVFSSYRDGAWRLVARQVGSGHETVIHQAPRFAWASDWR